LLQIRAEGVVMQDERFEALVSWMTHPLFRPNLDAICDFSDAASIPTMSELRELVGFVARHTEFVGRPKIAVVAKKAITFAMAQEFASLAGRVPLDVRVFSDRESAMTWLGRPADKDVR
jgi:hypothetical protein